MCSVEYITNLTNLDFLVKENLMDSCIYIFTLLQPFGCRRYLSRRKQDLFWFIRSLDTHKRWHICYSGRAHMGPCCSQTGITRDTGCSWVCSVSSWIINTYMFLYISVGHLALTQYLLGVCFSPQTSLFFSPLFLPHMLSPSSHSSHSQYIWQPCITSSGGKCSVAR